MELLTEKLAESPIHEGQRVLALTFMHGARRRLADRLRTVAGLSGRFQCNTIDGFAWRLFRRWRGLASTIGIAQLGEGQFDAICSAAATLLEQPQVLAWVAISFPIVIVDEGQDLHPERLRMLVAMSGSTHTLIAADEFQCLSESLRPNPLVSWLQNTAQTEILTQVRRTSMVGLLNAATSVRNGQAPANYGQQFKMVPTPSVPFAAAAVANAIAWHPGTREVAIITPSLAGRFAKDVVERVCERPCGKQNNGPFPIRWEGTDSDETQALIANLNLEPVVSALTIITALRQLQRSGPVRSTIAWAEKQVHALGRTDFNREEIKAVIERNVTLGRHFSGAQTHRFTALTVQQAKNREFDGVVLLWPYQVGGDPEHKRRLLYNAITRARSWCNIIAQGQNSLAAPPFA
jgi:UvrD-like helicase C-terminal domain